MQTFISDFISPTCPLHCNESKALKQEASEAGADLHRQRNTGMEGSVRLAALFFKLHLSSDNSTTLNREEPRTRRTISI